VDQRFSGKSDASGKFDFSQLQFLPACLKSVRSPRHCSLHCAALYYTSCGRSKQPSSSPLRLRSGFAQVATDSDSIRQASNRIECRYIRSALAREVLRIKTYSIAWRVLKSATTVSAPKSGKKCATDRSSLWHA
jgi:hypothetical protein